MRHRRAGAHDRAMASIDSAATVGRPDARPRTVVEVHGLEKRYGSSTVVGGISFSVREGELFGLLGSNGAGKTTTVEILQGLRPADGGSVTVLGLDPQVEGDRLRRLIGAQLQDAALPERMRVGEALGLFASLHPSPRPLDELAEEWQLAHLWRRPFGALSGGERQRLFVALALVGRPALVFLDELTQNLDPLSRRHTWDVVRRVRDSGTTVVLVTHDVEEAERLCDRIVVMHHGRVVADGTPSAIVSALGGAATVSFTDPDLDLRRLRDVPGLASVSRRGPRVDVVGSGPILAHVGARLVDLGRPPLDLRVHQPTLEERFVDLVKETSR
jgi:ABC-2 type transport system ATP-binding protein